MKTADQDIEQVEALADHWQPSEYQRRCGSDILSVIRARHHGYPTGYCWHARSSHRGWLTTEGFSRYENLTCRTRFATPEEAAAEVYRVWQMDDRAARKGRAWS